MLAAPDRDTSEWSAESLGRVEVETLAEGVSYDTPRDGVTLSARRDLRPLVLPAEVARLENLTGYLKFPGSWPVARIALTYKDRSPVAQRFVPREDGETGSGGQAPAGRRMTSPQRVSWENPVSRKRTCLNGKEEARQGGTRRGGLRTNGLCANRTMSWQWWIAWVAPLQNMTAPLGGTELEREHRASVGLLWRPERGNTGDARRHRKVRLAVSPEGANGGRLRNWQ